MGYPTSVPSFTNKNAGDVIQPAHVNDLQTEVSAVETGLLNGLSHPLIASAGFTSSNSTVANLNVTGQSTIANLTVTSSFVAPIPTALVTSSQTTQIAADGNWVGLNWETEASDPDGMHSTSASSSRVTCAASSGVYAVGVHLDWGGSTGYRAVRILQNDVIASPIASLVTYGPTDGVTTINHAISGLFIASDTTAYATVQVRIPSGSTGRIALGSASEHRFWMHRVRK